MGMNKDVMIDSLVGSIAYHLSQDGIALNDAQKRELKADVLGHVNEWQQDLTDELMKLASKLNDGRTEYITGLRDAIDIIHGAGDMEPLGSFNVFADPKLVSTNQIERAANDAALKQSLENDDGR